MATKTPKTYASDDNLTVTDGSVESLADALASTSNGYGASLIGIEDVGTKFVATDVEAALTEAMTDLDQAELDIGDLETKQAAGNILMIVSKQVLLTDITALGAVLTGTVDFDAALPANAQVVGAWFEIAANVTDGAAAAVVIDIGFNGGDVDQLVDGEDATGGATGVALVASPGVAFDGTQSAMPAGGQTPMVTITDPAANLSTMTAGDFTAYVSYLLPA